MVPRTFNIRRTFLYHKRFFLAKEGSSDYKKVWKRWMNGSLWNQKIFFYGIALKNLLSTFSFKSASIQNAYIYTEIRVVIS